MNRLLFVSTTSALFSKTTSHFIKQTPFSSFSTSLLPPPPSSSSSSLSLLWKGNIRAAAAIKPITLVFALPRFRVRCFSSTQRSSRSRKADSMEEDKDAFYVVRKGDIVGVYKSLSDCQAQVGSSVCDPSVSVYKGYSLGKDAEEHLTSRGLKNAIYTISAVDVNEDLFGSLIPCPFQQPAATGKASKKPLTTKRSQEVLESDTKVQPAAKDNTFNKPSPLKRSIDELEPAGNVEPFGSSSFWADVVRKQVKADNSVGAQGTNRKCVSCTLAFDGASKGNPGQAGAGAVLRADDGSLVWRLREGVGIATNNVAEYRAFILGLKQALKKGFKHIRVQGDSKLVCMQVQGLWKLKNENMATLCKEAKVLVDKFLSFQINHVLRDLNSEADAQANLALNLSDGQVQESCEET